MNIDIGIDIDTDTDLEVNLDIDLYLCEVEEGTYGDDDPYDYPDDFPE